MLEMTIWSVKTSEEERATWKAESDLCPVCGERFGLSKQVKVSDPITGEQVIVHKRCGVVD